MKKPVDEELKTALKSGPVPTDFEALDHLSAIIETEFYCSEIVCLGSGESKYLSRLWRHACDEDLPNISGIPATPIQSSGRFAAIDQLAGIAANGKRSALITSAPIRQELPAGIPFVIHSLTRQVSRLPRGTFFQLIARNPQQAADLGLIAHRTAELSLCPGVVAFQQDLQVIEYDMVRKLDHGDMRTFLGLPGDEIKTPTAHQGSFFGETRRRIPPSSQIELSDQKSSLKADVPALTLQAMREFEGLVKRSFGLIEERNTASAQVVIIAGGEQYNWLERHLEELTARSEIRVGIIHPTLLSPFPGHLIAHILNGKVGLVVDPDGAESAILKEIQLGFDKALTNGLYNLANKALPYPDYPAFARVEDRPRVYSCGAFDGSVAEVEELTQIIKKIETQSLDALHIEPAAKGRRKSADRQIAAEDKGVLRIIYRSPDAYFAGRNLTEKMHKILNLRFKVFGEPLSHLLRINLARKSTSWAQPPASAELMVSPTASISKLKLDLAHLKAGGTLLLHGNPQFPDEFWQSLSAECRSFIKKKKIKLYLVNMFEGESGADLSNAVILGSFLKIAATTRFAGIGKSVLEGARNSISSNGDLDFARAVRKGSEEVREIDYSEIDLAQAKGFVPGDESPIREEAGEEIDSEKINQDAIFRELLVFHQTGKQNAQILHKFIDLGLLPVHLHQYRDLSRARGDYPICLTENDPENVAVPLIRVFDEIISEVDAEGDEGESLRHDILRLESAIKSLVEQGVEGRFSRLWDLAADSLISEYKKSDESKEVLRKNLHAARKSLEIDGEVVPCNQQTPERLLHAAWKVHWAKESESFRQQLDELIIKLMDILKADFIHSPEARKPENLEASFATVDGEDLDFGALSNILEESPHGEPLPAKRHERISATLRTLKTSNRLFTCESTQAGADECEDGRSVPDGIRSDNLAAALGGFQAQMHSLVEFFRAVQIAKLEIENRYREEKHDRFFAKFKLEHLTAEEAALFPPLLIYVAAGSLDESDKNAMIEILASGLPLKILVLVDQLNNDAATPFDAAGASHLASIAMSLHSAYVLQTTTSDYHHMSAGFGAGLNFNGPALFCAYTGLPENSPRLHPYLVSAAALESRGFPSFYYDPGKGGDLASRFSIDANPQFENEWAVNEITYENVKAEQESLQVPFTFVDFMATDVRFAKYFMLAPRIKWHENMIPVAEYLQLDEGDCEDRIPYILMAEGNGILHRVIVSQDIVVAAKRIAANWRSLQEQGGIGSSHVQQLVEKEKTLLEEKKQKELEEIDKIYQAELDKSVGEVTREIVSNIAAGLLSQSAAEPVTTPAPSAPIASPPVIEEKSGEGLETATEEISAAPAAELEEEEEISFDEPYIETPRCTTCNECTDINAMMFSYNENKQAYIKDPDAGTYRQMVDATEKCPVRIIHPGKPRNASEPGLDELVKRAEPFL